MAAARALLRHTDLPARRIAEESMKIAAELCVYTNDRLTFEEFDPS
jgi:ATP-dependent HslUV protease subunit HslV